MNTKKRKSPRAGAPLVEAPFRHGCVCRTISDGQRWSNEVIHGPCRAHDLWTRDAFSFPSRTLDVPDASAGGGGTEKKEQGNRAPAPPDRLSDEEP